MNRFNPYGVEKDYECKTCFAQCYHKEIRIYQMADCQIIGKVKWDSETIDSFTMTFHPVCPKCGDNNMKVIIHSYNNGSLEEAMDGGKWEFGFSISSLGYYTCVLILI